MHNECDNVLTLLTVTNPSTHFHVFSLKKMLSGANALPLFKWSRQPIYYNGPGAAFLVAKLTATLGSTRYNTGRLGSIYHDRSPFSPDMSLVSEIDRFSIFSEGWQKVLRRN